MVSHGLSASVEGADRAVRAVNTLEEAVEGELTFLSNPKYTPQVAMTRASAVVLREDVPLPDGLSAIRCGDPYAAITAAIIALHGYRKHPQWGISPQASVDATARMGAATNIAPGATIAANAVIGRNCTIYPGCYVAEHVRIGDECVLYPNVVIYDGCELGSRVTIHAGSVIGEDGLGYAPYEGKWVKIPQVGRTVIGDDVEIGANCAIDRATLGRTEIGSGTKFGNVIVIGHGTRVGPDCLFVGLVGIAGSVNVGRHVTLAGQVGVAGHCSIGDDVQVGAQAGISGDVESGMRLLGSPAMEISTAKRAMIALQKLPEMVKRVREMEKEIEKLRQRLDGGAAEGGR